MKRAQKVLSENLLDQVGIVKKRLRFALVVLNFLLLLSTISIPQVSSSPYVAAYYPSAYNPVSATRYVSGALSDLQTDNAQYMTYRTYISTTSPSAKTNAFITYRSNSGANTLNSPKNRAWDGDTASWGSETEMPTAASPVRAVRTAICPRSERALEKIVVTLSDDGYLDAYVFDGVSWSVTNNIGQAWASSPSDARRPFDVAYESSSGDAILVYGTTVASGTTDLAYRTWSYTSGWGPEQYVDDSGHSTKITATYAVLASNPTSDKVGMVYIDSTNSDANAMIWSGSSWGDSIELTGAVAISTEECVGVASESTSGAFIAVAGEGQLIKWARFTTSWSSVNVFDINGGATSAMNWLKLSSSQDNRLMLTSVDSASDLCTAVWDGNSLGNRQWSTASESVGSMTATSSITAMRFTAQASKAVSNVLVYIHTVAASPSYRFGIETSTTSYLPSGTYVGGTSNYAVATPTATGWLNVTLPSSATLTAGSVYHITVRYNSGTIGASNYITLRRLGTAPNMFRPKENTIDPWLNTIFSSTIQNRNPVFALKYSDGTHESTPYDTFALHNVYGANWLSERWTQSTDQTITGVNLPLTKVGTPPDSLYIVLRNETDSQDVATLTVPQTDITTTLQWYERYFSAPVKLVNGKVYRLTLRSPSSTSSNYFRCTSLATSQSGDLTYGGTSSLFSSSVNSGSTWTDTNERDLTYTLLSASGSTGWVVHPTWDTSVDTNAQRCADFEWEHRSQPNMRNQGLLVYGTTSGQITWRRFRAPTYMTSPTNVAMGTSTHQWVQLKSNPREVAGDTRIMGAVLEGGTAYDLGAIKWDGTAFTMVGSSTFTSDTTTFTYECFELEFQMFGDITEATCETEFSGNSNTETWTQLVWTIDCSFTTDSVTTTLQLYNYQTGSYPTSGDGYVTEVIGIADITKTQTITINPAYFRDSSGNWRIKLKGVKSTSALFDLKVDLVKLEVTYIDIDPPTWSSIGTNNTLAGQPTLFHVKWTDNYGLSGFIFATNNTGHWVNNTFATMSGAVSWSNVTKTLNITAGSVQWRVWANDTSNNWSDTGVLSVSPLHPPIASFTYSPPTPYTADTVTFNASASYDPDGMLTTYFWTFGDGTNGTGVVVAHAYTDNGAYTVTVTVTDNNGLTDTEAKSVTVLNRLPIASFTESASTAPTGTIVYFDASASYDPDGLIATYFWTFGDGASATGATVAHTYTNNGIYTVTLAVTDNEGATSTTTATKTITNRTPAATFTESATTVYTATIINFDASSSYDPDGTIVSYFWTFGDGINATGITVSHSYLDNGAYIVTLKLTDDDGATATATAAKTILNRSPVASFTESKITAYTSEVIYFDASSSYDQDGSIASFFWTFGDGSNVSGAIVSHSYADNGVYTVRLTLTDNDGATGITTATKTILNRPPVASFAESASTVLTLETIHFNAAGSYDPDGTIVTYFWTFGDGTDATGASVDHAYSDNGIYTVTLIVTDNDGGTASSTASKTIVNRAPIASFTESATTVYTYTSITFNAMASYDPDGTIASYTWSFGDGNTTTVTNPIVTHAYAENGAYNVVVTIADNDGATMSIGATKNVLNRAPIASFTETSSTILTGETVTFNAAASYDLDGSIASYLWAFGDGANASGATATHSYVDDGTYTVTLTIRDNDGAISTSTAVKTVLNRPPVASFTESGTSVYTGVAITFNASASYDPDGYITEYSWNFGDGSSFTGVTASHAYTDDGVYAITLTVEDDDGSISLSTASKTVLNRLPTASFTESAATALTNEVISFSASGSYDPDGTVVSYFWTFGDGASTTGLIVNHAYSDDGTYTVSLTVTDDDGATATATATKTILNRSPMCMFTESAYTVYTRTAITFDTSTSYDSDGTVVTYSWNFGDGNTTVTVNPVVMHTYLEDRTYAVTLTITDDDGATASASSTKTVLNRPPIAVFTHSPLTPSTGQPVTFDATPSYDPDGSVTGYSWNFGDGNTTVTVNPILTHTYTDNGTYAITLTVADNDGSTDIETKSMTVSNRAPVASFTESATTVLTNVAISFDASSSYDPDGSIVSYSWDFGDSSHAAGMTVSHTYANNGNYVVALTVTDNDGTTDTSTATKNVLNRPPVAAFTESAATAFTGETINFNSSSSYDPDGTVISHFWTFGDGMTATGLVVEHSYVNHGSYTVTLTVTDDDGATATSSATKTIMNRAPVASFTESATVVYTGELIQFDASASYDPDGSIVSLSWDFGDGTSANGNIVSHAYADDGTYVVTLTITDNDGATDSATAAKSVLNKPPTALFTESAATVYIGEVVRFNASQSYDSDGYIATYSWAFGDGATANGKTQTHVYALEGIYTVILVVIDNEGAIGSASATKTVLNNPPVATFTESAQSVNTGKTVNFDASGSYDPDGTIASYFWNFGDGATASGPTTGHAYSDDGTYTVTLTITDNDGATRSATSAKTVLNRYPVASFSVSATTVYTSTAISFNASESYDSDGIIVSYFWAFGDGTNNTGVLATHGYTDDGDYVATLTVRDDDGDTGTSTITIHVLNRSPVASFTESASTVYTGETVSFNAFASYDPDGTITTYVWNFGDGATATGVTVGHAYVDDGSYTVSLTVTDDDGATKTATAAKTVLNRPPVVSFTESAQSVVVGQIVYFDASSSYDSDGLIISYLWDFGDGATATGVTAQHGYSAPRVYTVVLTVTDNNGASASQSSTKAVEITRPVAVFTESAQTTYTGATITLNASNSYDPDGHIISYFWDFGDGVNASSMVAAHSYYENGSYIVTLIVTDNDGATATAYSTKTILDRPPVASFTESAYTVYIGQSITFDASASYDPDGTVVNYSWAFGDGTNILGVVVEHTYSTSGAHTVTLTVTDNDGTAASASASKTILWNEKPVASFTESAHTLLTSEFLSLDASTSYDPDGTVVSYLWDLGDGTNATGTSIAHAYPSDGTYIVRLTITDNVGASGAANATKVILNRAPVTYFTESATTVYTHEAITFNASGSYDNDGAIASYLWDFGDGTNATGIIVSHSYADNGTYTVTLTATDDDDAYNSTAATKTVLIRPPVATFTESTETIHTGQYILFNASGSYDPDGFIISYLWDFGDGATASEMVTEHAYSIEGAFTVTLTVTEEEGISTSTTSTKTIIWNEPPVALFTESATTTYEGETIVFYASSSYDSDGFIANYSWIFGDGTNTTEMIVEHIYSDAGTYVVTLTVTDYMGASSSISATKTVLNRIPIALFTESSTTVYTLEAITFNASNSYDPYGWIASYSWAFGDGTYAVGPVIQHTYTENGQYTVTLTLTDNDGATGSASATKTVLNRHPLPTFTTSPVTVYTGDLVTFDASGSYDIDGTIVIYFWQFGDEATAYGKVVNHAYTENRPYTITLAATDNDMATTTTTKRIVVFNRAPVAAFTESAQTSYQGVPIGFDASGSYDPDGTIITYSWSFGDATTATGITANHAYTLSGSYTVTLTITDNDGSSSSVQATKTILANVMPVASFTESTQSVHTGEAVVFDASASYDSDGSIASYSWTFGDGSIATGSLVQHIYLKSGSYTATLTVRDNRGAGNTASATKTVLNRLPVASFTESIETAYVGETIFFDASPSYDLDGSIVIYLWNFGDGTNANGAIAGHAYSASATFTVTLVVTDDNGGSNTAQTTKTILGGLRDVAVVDIVPSAHEVYKRQALNVSVVVANEGTETESFNVTLYSADVYGWHLVEMDGRLVWYSDGDNSADFLLLTSITLPTDNPILTFSTRYETESLYDYCFVQISTDGGATWVSLENAHTTSNHQPNTDPGIISNLPGLTGTSINWPTWRTMTFSLNSYAGESALLGFRYMTDVGHFKEGWYIDNVAINGIPIPNQAFTQQTQPSLNAIQTIPVTNLAPDTRATVVFSWNTTNTFSGRYSLIALATQVRAEIDTSDNLHVNGVVEVKANPDIDGDGDVDIFDIVYIASIYGCKEGEARWNPRADLVENNRIDIFDVVCVASHYGEKIP